MYGVKLTKDMKSSLIPLISSTVDEPHALKSLFRPHIRSNFSNTFELEQEFQVKQICPQ